MTTALITVLGVALAGLLAMVQANFVSLRGDIRDLRLEITDMRHELGRLGQEVKDHSTDHPAPGRRA